MVALLLSLAAALAQAPASPLGSLPPGMLPPGFEASIAQAPRAEARWFTARTTSKRFPGEQVEGPVFEQGERVDFILAENGLARVRQGDRYGWVPESALTTQAPAAPPPSPEATGSPLLTAPPLLVPKTP